MTVWENQVDLNVTEVWEMDVFYFNITTLGKHNYTVFYKTEYKNVLFSFLCNLAAVKIVVCKESVPQTQTLLVCFCYYWIEQLHSYVP